MQGACLNSFNFWVKESQQHKIHALTCRGSEILSRYTSFIFRDKSSKWFKTIQTPQCPVHFREMCFYINRLDILRNVAKSKVSFRMSKDGSGKAGVGVGVQVLKFAHSAPKSVHTWSIQLLVFFSFVPVHSRSESFIKKHTFEDIPRTPMIK